MLEIVAGRAGSIPLGRSAESAIAPRPLFLMPRRTMGVALSAVGLPLRFGSRLGTLSLAVPLVSMTLAAGALLVSAGGSRT